MKKIYITLIILMTAMLGMAYLYFSKLNTETSYNDISLHAATANSGLVFCMQNDKSIFEILKGQDLFQQLLGEDKFNQLKFLKEKFIANPALNNLIAHNNIFISFSSGKDKSINYLISTQVDSDQNSQLLLETIKTNGIKLDTSSKVTKIIFNDSTSFYLAIEKNLIVLSNEEAPVKAAISSQVEKSALAFTDFIKVSNKMNKNSVGNLYIDFNRLPQLIKQMIPGNLNGSLAVLKNQDSFSVMNYNFSKERLFFNGSSKINNKNNYLSLYTNLEPQKNSIDNLLPDYTANFTLFSIPSYKKWAPSLQEWFKLHNEEADVKKIITKTDKDYHLNVAAIFPVYFKDQLISFQLKSTENIGAINLSNGDKVKQLLLDLSEDYDQDIKKLKVAGLLYCYFGEPLKKFSTPYYTIIDNYMVFSNQASALRLCLSKYKKNELLISNKDYVSLYSQISDRANVTYYVNGQNSTDLARNTIYSTYYKHYRSAKGLGNFNSFIYQLSGDKGNFQTNCLISTNRQEQDENFTAN